MVSTWRFGSRWQWPIWRYYSDAVVAYFRILFRRGSGILWDTLPRR